MPYAVICDYNQNRNSGVKIRRTHMEIKFNCTGTERKRLAQAIGMIVEARPEYQFMPTCAYKIGQHTLDKNGTLHFT